MARNYKQGLFKPRFPEKYDGNPTQIVYRSNWENVVMKYFDQNPQIVKWSSEEVIVPYFDKGSNKNRRYFPDFIIKVKQSDGTLKTIMIEVKPYGQTIPPAVPKRSTRKTQQRLLEETQTYATNTSKWEAAKEFCRLRGWQFMILTEREIYGKKV